MRRLSKPLELWWLIHHGHLLELCEESISGRRLYIKRYKSFDEVPVRLKWMRKVKRPDLIPEAGWRLKAVNRLNLKAKKAWDAYEKSTGPKRYKLWRKQSEALVEFNHAKHMLQKSVVRRCHRKAIIARHKKECPGCPFDYEKWTLFPS